MQAFTLSEKLGALDFEEKTVLLNALRKSLDHCSWEHKNLQEAFPGTTEQYWLNEGRAIYALYRKLEGSFAYPQFETSQDV